MANKPVNLTVSTKTALLNLTLRNAGMKIVMMVVAIETAQYGSCKMEYGKKSSVMYNL